MGLLSVRFIKYFKFPSYGHFSISSKGGEGQRICFDQNTVSMKYYIPAQVGALKQESARVFSKRQTCICSVSLVVCCHSDSTLRYSVKAAEITCSKWVWPCFQKTFKLKFEIHIIFVPQNVILFFKQLKIRFKKICISSYQWNIQKQMTGQI